MRPVPGWVSQVSLPLHGEEYTDFWGPLATTINSERMFGSLVLSSYRVLFLRGTGPNLSGITVQLAIPLNLVHRVLGERRHDEGRVVLNHLEFSFHAASQEAAGGIAGSIAEAIAAARTQRLAELHRPVPPPPPPPPGAPVVQREVIREIVKLPCRYCGSLVEVTAIRCPSCGAALR